VLIGGSFTNYNNTGRSRIARLNSDGSVDTTFDPSSGANGTVRAIAAQPDGKVLIGGDFTAYNGTARGGIARLNRDGSLDTTFSVGTGVFGFVYSVALQLDGKVLISGFFFSYNGTGRTHIARLNSDGSLDASFNPGTGPNQQVNAMAVQADGKVLIGGWFTSYNGTVRKGIARLNSDGTLDTTFDPGSVVNNAVFSMRVQADGKVLIGGYFDRTVARLNGDGSLDPSFNPPGFGNIVTSVAVQADGKLLIGGQFIFYIGGTARARIARLNSDGSQDLTFNPGTGANNQVSSIAVQADGKVFLGGDFTSFNGSARNYIARLNGDGSLDTTFGPGVGASSKIFAVAVQDDGGVLIGGNFGSYAGVGCSFLARLMNDTATQSLSAPNISRVQWLRGGAASEIEQVRFEHSTDGANWIGIGTGSRIGGGWQLTGLSLTTTGYIRARGRAAGGYFNGCSSVIEQLTSYSFGATSFASWAAAAGLVGSDATPTATPHSDGVQNLLKYAFAMNGSGPDVSVLVPGTGTSGQPVFAVVQNGPLHFLRFEFVRRIGSGLLYTPRKSSSLSTLSWLPLAATATVLPIDGNWERIIYEEPFDPVTTPMLFGRVEVTLP
jgi:uncharacterized delta-60 repeat protein